MHVLSGSVLSSAWPAGPAGPVTEEDDDSEDWEPPRFFRTAENSADLPARDTEEQPRDNQGAGIRLNSHISSEQKIIQLCRWVTMKRNKAIMMSM
ncbi:hypothetical protein DV515_00019704 [Chloebia gouldiae]|uniref:Uncharacterized protein n=1 Tax=Chloebia gouldiae TaxID=44316 RepID=A0A3L8Q420_CHLGU|nr:hypothetical protein DV515_00019704 [Chloebia gouldiae]